jgi:uncharacterized protein DUF6174
MIPLVSRVRGLKVKASAGGYRPNGEAPWASMRTVELLFAEARRAALSDAEEVSVDLDPKYSYPTRIHINEVRDLFDEERTWLAELKVLQP